jgi:pilus assembly protein CpaC
MQTRIAAWLLNVAGLILVTATFVVSPARGEDPPPRETGYTFQVASKNTTLQIIEKSSRVLEFKNRVRSVDGFDPNVIKVTAPSDPHHIRIQTLAAGLTSLVIVDESGANFDIEVLVIGDVRQLEALIRQNYPDSSVKAVKIRDSVLLTGSVNKAEDIPTIIQIAEQFHPNVLNSLHITGVQQVLLKVQVMEVQRGKIRQMGFNYWLNGLHGNRFTNISTPGNLVSTSTYGSVVGGAASVASTAFGNTTGIMHIASNDATLDAFIEALKQETLLKVLAEPNLMTVNGRPADFLSGGEFPILVPQGVGTATVAYKQFGIQLVFVPTVLSSGRLRLDVAPEVSERDFSSAIVLAGTTVTGIKTRRANTQVEMNFGETLVIAGLISVNVFSSTQKVPFLGELPWVGAAFRRVKHEENETELLILVTPEYVAPLEEGQLSPARPGSNTTSPTDRELYIDGRMEIRRYDNDCPLPVSSPVPKSTGVVVPEPESIPLAPPLPPATASVEPTVRLQPASPKVPDSVSSMPQVRAKSVAPVSKPVLRDLPLLIGPESNAAPIAAEKPETTELKATNEAVPSESAVDLSRVKNPMNNVARRPTPTRSGSTPPNRPTAKARPGLIGPGTAASAQTKSTARPGLIEP